MLTYQHFNPNDRRRQGNPAWNCHKCGTTIHGDGYLTVNHSSARRNHKPAIAATDGVFTDLTEWWDYEPEPWRAYHNQCGNPTSNGYDIPIGQADTWHKVFERTAHMATKNWFANTNWFDFALTAGGHTT